MNTPEINDGGPAFPVASKSTDGHQTGSGGELWQFTGMSLRDWFAGQALQGMYAGRSGTLQTEKEMLLLDASIAYESADAMLIARNKK